MLYWLIKPFVLFALNIFYRIDVRGLKHVPKGVPVVLAPNHMNGFVDPVVLAMHLPQKVRFFARGDVFKGKFAGWILNQLNVSPMFRIEEGFSEIKKNDKTFEECRRLLTADGTLLIFPEGLCVSQRRLQNLRKGLGRIVFQTGESFGFEKDIVVIPVGVNFLFPTKFRSRVSIDVGTPMSAKKYYDQFRQDKVRTINEFTKHLQSEMVNYVSIIKNKENDELVAWIEEIYTHQWLKDNRLDTQSANNRYAASREMIAMVNVLDEQKPERIALLKEKLGPYLKALHKHDLRDHLFREESVEGMNIGTFILEYVIIYLGMPIYAIGLLMNFPPYLLAKRFADKKIKKPEFYASIRAYLSLMLWSLYFLVQLIVVGIISSSWAVLCIYAAGVCLSALYVLKFYPRMRKIFGRWKLLRMVRKQRKEVEDIVTKRSEAMQALAAVKEEYLKLK